MLVQYACAIHKHYAHVWFPLTRLYFGARGNIGIDLVVKIQNLPAHADVRYTRVR